MAESACVDEADGPLEVLAAEVRVGHQRLHRQLGAALQQLPHRHDALLAMPQEAAAEEQTHGAEPGGPQQQGPQDDGPDGRGLVRCDQSPGDERAHAENRDEDRRARAQEHVVDAIEVPVLHPVPPASLSAGPEGA